MWRWVINSKLEKLDLCLCSLYVVICFTPLAQAGVLQ